MANPQAENGHVRIANEIVEQLMRVNLPAYEWRVLWCVLRKTWGWRKKTDIVPLSQIAKITGIQRPNVVRAKKSLLKKRLLIKEKGRIGFNKDYEQWEIEGYVGINLDTGGGINSDTTQGVSNQITGGICIDNKVVSNQIPSKDNKETTQKKRQPHRKLVISDTFSNYWNSKPNLQHIRSMTDSRKKKLAARMKERDFAEHWWDVIDRISASAFCTGGGEKGWKASVDWLLGNSTNYVKVLEGKYDEVKHRETTAEQVARMEREGKI